MKTKSSSNLTQRERLLDLLKSRGSKGVYVYEINAPRPTGLGIAQYNTRIRELRQSGHNIINVEPGHFVLNSFESNTAQAIVQTDTRNKVSNKLEVLQEQIKEVEARFDIASTKIEKQDLESQLKVLRMRARALEIGLEKRDFQGEVMKTLTQGALV